MTPSYNSKSEDNKWKYVDPWHHLKAPGVPRFVGHQEKSSCVHKDCVYFNQQAHRQSDAIDDAETETENNKYVMDYDFLPFHDIFDHHVVGVEHKIAHGKGHQKLACEVIVPNPMWQQSWIL